jgi:Leucine Rich repeat
MKYLCRLTHNAKLQVLFLRASNIQDDDLKQICHALKPDPANPAIGNKTLKVLDLSYNPLTPSTAVGYLADMLDVNRTLEYIGLAKCGL